MYGISHNIPGTINHIIYQTMNVTDKLEFNVYGKLKKYNIESYGKSLSKEKY